MNEVLQKSESLEGGTSNDLEAAHAPVIEIEPPPAAREVADQLLQTRGHHRVAVAQIKTLPGRIAENRERIIACIREARRAGARVVVFPELAITGYCAMDLLLNRDYITQNLLALDAIRKETQGITAIVGFVDTDPTRTRSGGRPTLYNSAAIIHDGVIVGVRDKTLYPNYDIFFEDRYFAPARSQGVVEAGGLRIGTEICEDLWSEGYHVDVTDELAKEAPDLIVNLSASPFHIGKLPVRAALVSDAARRTGTPFIYANLIGAQDGYEGEVVFDGRSLIVNRSGETLGVAKSFEEDLLIVDLHTAQPISLPQFTEVEELHDALVLGIRDYFYRFGRGSSSPFSQVVIGISGGIDSALVAALAVEALGPDKVLGITMPSRYSSSETKGDAYLLAERLGIRMKTVPIEDEFTACTATLRADPEIAETPEDVSEENIQARLRMINLMYYANKCKGLVLNTGNKTELALDNCTIYGDMVGGFSVLGDVDKDRVYALARYINAKAGFDVIPTATIERAPSAELKADQDDSHVMGAMPQVLAPMVRTIIEEGLSFSDAKRRFTGEFSESLIESTFRKLDRSEWKRRQASPAIRVTPHAFGNGRKVPIGHGFLE